MKSNLIFFFCLLIVCLPTVVFANTPAFESMVLIPGVNANDPDLNNYINAIYRLSISLAALLAVVKIVIAGAKYMLDDIVTHKEEAKQDIWGALMGLLVIIAAVLILNTVNTDLTHTQLILATTPVVPVAPAPPKTDQQIACDTGGGCELISCSNIGLSIGTYVTDGAIAGGLVGATGIFVLGPGGTVTVVGGALIGSVIGGVFYITEDYVSCNTVCAWRYGTMLDSNTCSVPVDKKAYLAAEAENIVARVAAEHTALVAECTDNLNNEKCCSAGAGIYDGTTCTIGETVPIPGGYTGEPASFAELDCLTGPGYKWDELNEVCRVKPLYEYKPFPVDGDRTYLLECELKYGTGWSYNPPPADNCKYANVSAF